MRKINPQTWEAAAGLMANSIDTKRAKGVSHPHSNDHDLLLAAIRNEYDSFAAIYYGAEMHEEIGVNWFSAIAIMILDMVNFYYDNTVTLKAETVLPLLRRKQQDYGYENIDRFGTDGLFVRIHDKIARLENIAKHTEGNNRAYQTNYETAQDTFIDLIGYCIIGCMVVRDLWRLPMQGDHEDILA